MTAESCPHCFAPARANGRPGCTCAARAAASAASAATAGETDDQTHLRPYVTLSEESAGGPDPRDLRLFDEPQKPEKPERPGKGDAEETRVLDRVEERRGGDEAAQSSDAALSDAAGSAAPDADEYDAPGPSPVRHRRSRRKTVATVLAGAAAVAVAGSLAIGTGLLGGDHQDDGGGSDDRALADIRTSAPADDTPADEGSASGTPSPSATAHPSASGSARASATPSETAAPATAHPSASASAPRSTAQPEPTASGEPTADPSDTPGPTGPPVLSEGDSGAEVVELQKRLAQLLLYIGVADGEYDAGVRNAVSSYQGQHDITGDPDGVYGENTRHDLESRTDEP
ncbi:peptidoglycan-binding domain-containing protein [Streptomyces sp. S465]|uniref:peptidoglycan-binding domain-containing protein n=1 Tax=Streptomyces sp. S465 TaxID=2979468 RepID=UPI0022A850F2|nr:peptidoglycan-binding protein [Streptomyces sp. S465]WAP55748.1 peptidoglycan-binding protein [Streptomyces sp. S465]